MPKTIIELEDGELYISSIPPEIDLIFLDHDKLHHRFSKKLEMVDVFLEEENYFSCYDYMIQQLKNGFDFEDAFYFTMKQNGIYLF